MALPGVKPIFDSPDFREEDDVVPLRSFFLFAVFVGGLGSWKAERIDGASILQKLQLTITALEFRDSLGGL